MPARGSGHRLKRTRFERDALANCSAGQLFPKQRTVIFERTGARTSRVRTSAPLVITLPARRITGKGYMSWGPDEEPALLACRLTSMVWVSVCTAPAASRTSSRTIRGPGFVNTVNAPYRSRSRRSRPSPPVQRARPRTIRVV